MNKELQILLLFACLFAPGHLAEYLHPNDYAGGRSRSVEASAERNTSAFATMLGEFRTALSDIMYIKTERYLHSGVAYEPHLEADTLNTVGTIKDIDTDHAKASSRNQQVVEPDSAGIAATLIPTAQKDWRGFIGTLHRKVKPWRDPSEPHLLTDGREMLPWFRVMTMTDPHYVRGYAVGAWWLKRRNLDAAITFAQEGITNNPTAFEIYYTLGELFMERGRKANNGGITNPGDEALKHFLAARDAFQKGAELAIAKRPHGWVDDPKNPSAVWNANDETDAIGTVHLAVLTEKNFGDPQKAIELARRYLAVFPADAPLNDVAKPSQ